MYQFGTKILKIFLSLPKLLNKKQILITTYFLIENHPSILLSSDDKTLEIDADYAKETLNKNLLKRLEIAW